MKINKCGCGGDATIHHADKWRRDPVWIICDVCGCGTHCDQPEDKVIAIWNTANPDNSQHLAGLQEENRILKIDQKTMVKTIDEQYKIMLSQEKQLADRDKEIAELRQKLAVKEKLIKLMSMYVPEWEFIKLKAKAEQEVKHG